MSVSIIIPTYNRADHLERALTSALTQTVHDVEVLVVDDGSSDHTERRVRSLEDSRITYIRHPKNLGKARAWLTGMEHATREFVGFLPDDDVMLPAFVAQRVHQFEVNRDAAVVFSPYEIRSTNGERLAVVGADSDREETLDPFALLRAALSRRWFLGASLYRRNALTHLPNRVVNSGNALDLAINVELALRGASGIFIPVVDFIYSDHPGQTRHDRRWQETFASTDQFLMQVISELRLERRLKKPMRRERSNWHVVWARRLAERGHRMEAFRRSFKALAIDPTNAWAWSQTIRPLTSGIRRFRTGSASETTAMP